MWSNQGEVIRASWNPKTGVLAGVGEMGTLSPQRGGQETWRQRLECCGPGNAEDCRGLQRASRHGRTPQEPPDTDTAVLGLRLQRERANVCCSEPLGLCCFVSVAPGHCSSPQPVHSACAPHPPASAPPTLPPSQGLGSGAQPSRPRTRARRDSLPAAPRCLHVRESLLAALPATRGPCSPFRQERDSARLLGRETGRGFPSLSCSVGLTPRSVSSQHGRGTSVKVGAVSGTGGICCLRPSEPRTIWRLLRSI